MQKIFLSCPFDDKEECKSLGGKWDAESRSWFITSNLDIEKFEKWIVPGAIAKAKDSEDNGRTYLNVPFKEKDACKEMGGYWDAELMLWFVPAELDTEPFEKWFFEKPSEHKASGSDSWNGKTFLEHRVGD